MRMSNCDACSTKEWVKGSKIPDHDHRALFTFGIGYRHGNEMSYEEIDIWARDHDEAVRLAKITADEGYDTGYTEIVTLQPGGSGGLIQIWSS